MRDTVWTWILLYSLPRPVLNLFLKNVNNKWKTMTRSWFTSKRVSEITCIQDGTHKGQYPFSTQSRKKGPHITPFALDYHLKSQWRWKLKFHSKCNVHVLKRCFSSAEATPLFETSITTWQRFAKQIVQLYSKVRKIHVCRGRDRKTKGVDNCFRCLEQPQSPPCHSELRFLQCYLLGQDGLKLWTSFRKLKLKVPVT